MSDRFISHRLYDTIVYADEIREIAKCVELVIGNNLPSERK